MKNILITGTSSGLGEGLALYYLNKANRVFGISRRESKITHENYTHCCFDLTNYENSKILQGFLQDINQLDYVILNAGVLGKLDLLKDSEMIDLKNTMEVNLWSVKNVIDEINKNVLGKKIFIAISSGAAVNGNKGWNGYSLSKAALNMLISIYAKEDELSKYYSFAPGLVQTAMQEQIRTYSSEDFPSLKRIHEASGTEKMPSPSELAPKFDSSIQKLLQLESGSFADIRSL